MTDYWIIGATSGRSGNRKLHTDEDCPYLQQANTYDSTTREDYPEKPVCVQCRGDRPDQTGPKTLHDAALDADPDDLVTDGGHVVGPRGETRPPRPGDSVIRGMLYDAAVRHSAARNHAQIEGLSLDYRAVIEGYDKARHPWLHGRRPHDIADRVREVINRA